MLRVKPLARFLRNYLPGITPCKNGCFVCQQTLVSCKFLQKWSRTARKVADRSRVLRHGLKHPDRPKTVPLTKGIATGVVNFLTAMGLFIGQSPAFFELLRVLAEDADEARRGR